MGAGATLAVLGCPDPGWRGRRRPVSLAERGALGFGDGNGNKDAGFGPGPGLIRSGRRVGYSGHVGCRRRVWHSAACWATSLSRLAPAYGGVAWTCARPRVVGGGAMRTRRLPPPAVGRP